MKNKKLFNNTSFLASIFFNEITLYIYDIWSVIFLYKRGAAVLSGFFISQLLPVIFMLFFSLAIDKYNRKSILILTKILRILLYITLIINQSTITIYIVTFLLVFLNEVDSLVCNVLTTQIVEKNHIVRLSSQINTLYSVSMIVGPIIATVIMSFEGKYNLIFSLILFLIISMILIFLIDIKSINKEIDRSKLIKAKEGFFTTKIFNNYNTIFVIIFWSIFMFCIGVVGPLEITMINNILNMPTSYYSIGNTIEGVGTLIASISIMVMIKKFTPNKIISIGMILSAIGYMVIAFSNSIYIYFVGALLIGMTAGTCPFGFRTSLQVYTNNTVLGRTYSFTRFIVLNARLLGFIVSGMIVCVLSTRLIY